MNSAPHLKEIRMGLKIMAQRLQLQPETLTCILTGQRRIPFEAFQELDRRLNAFTVKLVSSEMANLNRFGYWRGV